MFFMQQQAVPIRLPTDRLGASLLGDLGVLLVM